MVVASSTDLAERIRWLQADRARHLEAIAEIDRVLGRVDNALSRLTGVAAAAGRATGEPASPMPDAGGVEPPPRRRGRFAKVAEESVLDFVRSRGNPSTADINAHWRAEGRKGTANVTILKLLQHGLIARVADPSVRGSRYVATGRALLEPAGDRGDRVQNSVLHS